MREFWRKTLILAAVGFLVGALVGLGFLIVYGIGAFYAEYGAGRLALHLAMSGLLGAVNMGSATIYSLERWGLLRCTMTHFTIAMFTLCTIGFLMGWFDLREPMTVWMLIICVTLYFIIWLIMSLRCRREVRQINEALKGWKNEQDDE